MGRTSQGMMDREWSRELWDGVRMKKHVSSRILVPPSDLKRVLFSHHALEHPRNFWVQTEAALF